MQTRRFTTVPRPENASPEPSRAVVARPAWTPHRGRLGFWEGPPPARRSGGKAARRRPSAAARPVEGASQRRCRTHGPTRRRSRRQHAPRSPAPHARPLPTYVCYASHYAAGINGVPAGKRLPASRRRGGARCGGWRTPRRERGHPPPSCARGGCPFTARGSLGGAPRMQTCAPRRCATRVPAAAAAAAAVAAAAAATPPAGANRPGNRPRGWVIAVCVMQSGSRVAGRPRRPSPGRQVTVARGCGHADPRRRRRWQWWRGGGRVGRCLSRLLLGGPATGAALGPVSAVALYTGGRRLCDAGRLPLPHRTGGVCRGSPACIGVG